jgi:hypothetical protein
MKRSNCNVIYDILPKFACKNYRKLQKACQDRRSSAGIWTPGVVNTRKECYPLDHYDK